jgi:hypothetical protein
MRQSKRCFRQRANAVVVKTGGGKGSFPCRRFLFLFTLEPLAKLPSGYGLCQGTTSVVPIKAQNKFSALQAAEKLATEGGGGFIPRIKPIKSTSALAAEGMFSGALPQTKPFSAACLAAAGM